MKNDKLIVSCPYCEKKTRVVVASPMKEGRDFITDVCACGHCGQAIWIEHSLPVTRKTFLPE